MGHSLTTPEPSRARRLADLAWKHRGDAARARREAEVARRLAVRLGDHAAASVADRTAAVALINLGESSLAVRRAKRAVTSSRAGHDLDVQVGALITLGGILGVTGRSREALIALDEACERAIGSLAIDARAQRAVTVSALGQRAQALAELSELLGGSHAPTDQQRAELLHDSGVVLAFLTRFDEAEHAFRQSATLFDELGVTDAAFDARRNLALLMVQAARLPQALALFDELARESSGDRQQVVWLGCVQMEALLAANMLHEALLVADRLVDAAQEASADLRAEAWRLCSSAFRLGGDLERAAAIARRAEPLFRRQGFGPFAAVSRRTWAAQLPARRRVAVLADVIDELAAAGLRAEVVTTRTERLNAALEARMPDVARHELGELRRVRDRSSTALVRLQIWQAEARWYSSEGDGAAARRAAAAGLRVLDDHRASLGATELRAHASGIGEELADIALRSALSGGRPSAVFDAAERWRASTLLARSATSVELDEALGELRRLLQQRDEVLSGEADAAGIERRCVEAEQAVRRLARGLPGWGAVGTSRVPSVGEVQSTLGQRTLVELVEHDDAYFAVIIGPATRPKLVRLGSAAPVRQATSDLGFALRRLARRGVGALAAAAAVASATESLDQLDGYLIAPLDLGVGPVVVVPPASLHTVPFPSLPSLSQADVTVVPSATWWWGATQWDRSAPSSESGRSALIAGPRLVGATMEVSSLAGQWPHSEVLTDESATTEAVARAIDGAGLVHLACHGHLRTDHPHLSSLELFDGPFTVYDFERLRIPPRRVVLAACDSAVGAERPGNELLGFLSALLSLGTGDVLASVVPVPDLATTEFMLQFHQAVRSGSSFAGGLRAARNTLDLSIPANFAASVAFVAFGIGDGSA